MGIELLAPDASSCNACPEGKAVIMVALGNTQRFTFRLCKKCQKDLWLAMAVQERKR
jgi:hypothetical protein